MPLPFVILQLAAGAIGAPAAADVAIAAGEVRPTIEFQARVRAREVTIEQNGEARLEVYAEPALLQDVEVTRNVPAGGQRRLRNLDIRLDAQATLDPASATGATAAPAAPAAAGTPAEGADLPQGN